MEQAKAFARADQADSLRGYPLSVRDAIAGDAYDRLDNILKLAAGPARPAAGRADGKRAIEEKSIAQAVDIVQRASKAIEQMEARAIEIESRALAVGARAAEDVKALDARLKAAEQRHRDLEARAEQSERRAREAETRLRLAEQKAQEADARAEAAERNGRQSEEWLRRLHDSITESFSGTLSTADWLRQIDPPATRTIPAIA